MTHQHDARQLARVVAAVVTPGVVLDVGSGGGAVAMRLLHLRPDVRVVGVEVASGAALESVRRSTAMGVADRYRVIRGDALAIRLPEAQSVVVNPPMLPTEGWFANPGRASAREGFAAALVRRLGVQRRTTDVWIHLFDFMGIERSYGWGTPLVDVAADAGFEMSFPHRGWRAVGPSSRIRDALPQLARLFPEAPSLVEGTPRPLSELADIGARSLLIPHSIVRLHRPGLLIGDLQ
ncbi:MAG: methyltransferase [Candidatus Limnocylindrales bacterium]